MAFQSLVLFMWSRSIAARRSAADCGSENTGGSMAECRIFLSQSKLSVYLEDMGKRWAGKGFPSLSVFYF